MLREKFIVINVYIKKEESPQISNLNLYLKALEIEEETKVDDKKE